MSEEQELAYLAGFWDGEGSFGIYWHKGSSRHFATVQMTNTDHKIVQTFHERFGGRIHLYGQKGHQNKHWHWSLNASTNKIRVFLLAMTPYLRQKKEEAETLMEFCNTISVDHKGRAVSPEVIEYRYKLAARIKDLKRNRND